MFIYSSPLHRIVPHLCLNGPVCQVQVLLEITIVQDLGRIVSAPDGRLQSLAAGQSQSRRAESAACNESKTFTGSLQAIVQPVLFS